MDLSAYRNHKAEAARFRSLAATATTAALKARLLEEADKHEQLARGDPPGARKAVRLC